MTFDAATINSLAVLLVAFGTLLSAIVGAVVSIMTLLQSRKNTRIATKSEASIQSVHLSVNGKMEEMKTLYSQHADDRVALAVSAGAALTAGAVTAAIKEVLRPEEKSV